MMQYLTNALPRSANHAGQFALSQVEVEWPSAGVIMLRYRIFLFHESQQQLGHTSVKSEEHEISCLVANATKLLPDGLHQGLHQWQIALQHAVEGRAREHHKIQGTQCLGRGRARTTVHHREFTEDIGLSERNKHHFIALV